MRNTSRVPVHRLRASRILVVAVTLSAVVAACGQAAAPGSEASARAGGSTGSAEPSGSAVASPSASSAAASPAVTRPPFQTLPLPGASSSVDPDASAPPPGARAISTAIEAIEAIGEIEPDFVGYRPQPPDVIGASTNALVEEDAEGFLVTFVTGYGDCFAGCINTRYDKFRVTYGAEVSKLCTWTTGDEEEGTPC